MSGYGDTYGFSWPGGPDYEPPPQPRCMYCQAFLPWSPDRSEPWEQTIACDGTATERLVYPEGELAEIIGRAPYKEYFSACGSNGGSHTAHDEIMAAGVSNFWTCRRCGKESRYEQ